VGTALLLNVIRFILLGLELMVLARVVLSFVNPAGRGPVASFIISTTEPILAPVRRLLPQTGALDWSPFVVVFVIGMLLRAVV
jgi:YggT family protein